MTVSALEESTLITWSTGELRMLMMSHPVIKSIFNTVVGKDITIKLYQVIAQPFGNKVGATQLIYFHFHKISIRSRNERKIYDFRCQ